MQFRLAAAQVELALGHLDIAGKEIQAVRAEATATGYVAFEFETRLALAEWMEASGKSAQSKALLMALQKGGESARLQAGRRQSKRKTQGNQSLKGFTDLLDSKAALHAVTYKAQPEAAFLLCSS